MIKKARAWFFSHGADICVILIVATISLFPYSLISDYSGSGTFQQNAKSNMPEEVKAALISAQENLEKPEGRNYDEILNQFAEEIAGVINQCSGRNLPDVDSFVILIRVGPRGNAEEAFVWPKIIKADCLKSGLSRITFPVPPRPSWWVKMEIVLRKDIVDAERFRSKEAIVYGSEAAVLFSAPEGWVIDNVSGLRQGLHCVIYPEGSSWEKAPAVMYITISLLKQEETIESSIAGDIDRFKSKYPEVMVKEISPLITTSGQKVSFRIFYDGGYKYYECVGYASFENSLICYVLTCHNKKVLEQNLEIFKGLVAKSLIMHKEEK
jgi:hypothetical protein